MKHRWTVLLVLAAALPLAALQSNDKSGKKAAPASKAPSSGPIENELASFAVNYLPYDPETKITVEKSTETIPGFQAYKIHRKGRYEKLKADKVAYLSDDGKWFFAGDTVTNTDPKPVKGGSDLSWLDTKFSEIFHNRVHAQLTPDRDAGGLKGVAVSLETGYFPVHLPGYVTSDGRYFLQGTLWDFHADPRVERRRRIDLSANRASGPANATVQVVEYADMECGYCKFRGLQMDRLMEANAGIVNVRRHYKFFPLWMGHVWSMKAASAADCIFKFAPGPAMFKFKSAVYARQDTLSVSGIDELAFASAEAEGISTADFLSCYLREDSLARVRKDVEEGYRLGVNSTPTYFIDGTEISWVEDKVMEDYLRTLFPKIKTIDYAR
ncbi:MAG TPA: thioredoxin domain-containing protein [Thermoanaerobaculia bacterium]|nr:thioredoxin domain-containing protein [Thermoanaerobaculia bacterium]